MGLLGCFDGGGWVGWSWFGLARGGRVHDICGLCYTGTGIIFPSNSRNERSLMLQTCNTLEAGL